MAIVTLPAATLALADTVTGTTFPTNEATTLGTGNQGFKFLNDGKTCVRFKVGAAGVGNITIVFTATVDGQTVANRVIAVANGQSIILGPFRHRYHDDASGYVTINKSAPQNDDSAGCYFAPGTYTD
jgi:hypothetical protein